MSQENDAVRDKDKKSEKMPLLWGEHEASAEIAAVLIRKHHQHLASAEIGYMCRNIAAKRSGKPVPGNIDKMSGKWKYISQEKDFYMEVALEVWNDLEPNQRIALVDHLLTRCTGEESEENGAMKWGLRPPEIQEFAEVAERNGQWHEGLVEFGEVPEGQVTIDPAAFPRWDWNRAFPPDRHVLVAEDHIGQQVRASSKLRDMFGGDGRMQVSLVPGGLYAAAIVRVRAPDLLILDHDMPDGNGQALLNWIISSGNVHIPVITFSGIDENNRRMEAASGPLFRSFHQFTKEQVLGGSADAVIYSCLGISPSK